MAASSSQPHRLPFVRRETEWRPLRPSRTVPQLLRTRLRPVAVQGLEHPRPEWASDLLVLVLQGPQLLRGRRATPGAQASAVGRCGPHLTPPRSRTAPGPGPRQVHVRAMPARRACSFLCAAPGSSEGPRSPPRRPRLPVPRDFPGRTAPGNCSLFLEI